MIEITLHGKNGSRTIEIKTPRGFPTRHVRTRNVPVPVSPKPPSETVTGTSLSHPRSIPHTAARYRRRWLLHL